MEFQTWVDISTKESVENKMICDIIVLLLLGSYNVYFKVYIEVLTAHSQNKESVCPKQKNSNVIKMFSLLNEAIVATGFIGN